MNDKNITKKISLSSHAEGIAASAIENIYSDYPHEANIIIYFGLSILFAFAGYREFKLIK